MDSWSLQDRDLSPVTDKLWKKFYKDSFGEDSFNTVVEKMRQKRVTFKWRKLYEVLGLLHCKNKLCILYRLGVLVLHQWYVETG